jgi:hypothetical protein
MLKPLRCVGTAKLRNLLQKGERSMQRKFAFLSIPVTMILLCASASASAQMAVHAVSGMVKAVNPDSKTMDVLVDTGETSHFKLSANAKGTLGLEKALQSDAIDASKFQGVGNFVVVYYYGFDYDRTAVAVKDLGTGPFQKVQGTVMNFDKHTRTLTMTDDGGKSHVFELSEHLIVDSGLSVASGRGYDPHRGDFIVVTYAQEGDKNSAVFIHSRK